MWCQMVRVYEQKYAQTRIMITAPVSWSVRQ